MGSDGGDGDLVLNNLRRCLGTNQGSGSLMSSGSSSMTGGGITGSVSDSLGITGSVGDSRTIVGAGNSLGDTGSVEDSSLVPMLELVRDSLGITGSVEDSLLVPKLGVIGSW